MSPIGSSAFRSLREVVGGAISGAPKPGSVQRSLPFSQLRLRHATLENFDEPTPDLRTVLSPGKRQLALSKLSATSN